jgi:hypothetical protein
MAHGTFDHTFTYEIERDEETGKVLAIGKSTNAALCEWVQTYTDAEDLELAVECNIEWEADRGCVSGPPDRWEQPYYGDERHIDRVGIVHDRPLGDKYVQAGSTFEALPWSSVPAAVRAVLETLVDAEDVDIPETDDCDDYDPCDF